jgi:hypothetical protein
LRHKTNAAVELAVSDVSAGTAFGQNHGVANTESLANGFGMLMEQASR